MRLEQKNGKAIENPKVEQLVEAVQGLAGGVIALVASDEPRSFLRVKGGPETFSLDYRDGLTQRLYQSITPQTEDVALVTAKAYLQGRSGYKSSLPWQEVTQEPGKVDKWSDPMPEQINRGGCTTVFVLAALLGGGLWLWASII